MSARRVLVVVAHPVPESFGQTLARTVIEQCRTRGDEVEVIDLYAIDFDPALTREEWQSRTDPSFGRRVHGDHARLLEWATSLVLVYPTWYGGHPAILKGWFDRVWTLGVAYELPAGAQVIRGRLRGLREITVVTTHGSPKLMNAIQGEPGKRLTGRGLRSLASWRCRRRWIAFYGMDDATDDERHAFLQRVTKAFA